MHQQCKRVKRKMHRHTKYLRPCPTVYILLRMPIVKRDVCFCSGCKHTWIPASLVDLPKRCAKCKTTAWNKAKHKPRKNKRANAAPDNSQLPASQSTDTIQSHSLPVSRSRSFDSPKNQSNLLKRPVTLKDVEKARPKSSRALTFREKQAYAKVKECAHGFARVQTANGVITACTEPDCLRSTTISSVDLSHNR